MTQEMKHLVLEKIIVRSNDALAKLTEADLQILFK